VSSFGPSRGHWACGTVVGRLALALTPAVSSLGPSRCVDPRCVVLRPLVLLLGGSCRRYAFTQLLGLWYRLSAFRVGVRPRRVVFRLFVLSLGRSRWG